MLTNLYLGPFATEGAPAEVKKPLTSGLHTRSYEEGRIDKKEGSES